MSNSHHYKPFELIPTWSCMALAWEYFISIVLCSFVQFIPGTDVLMYWSYLVISNRIRTYLWSFRVFINNLQDTECLWADRLAETLVTNFAFKRVLIKLQQFLSVQSLNYVLRGGREKLLVKSTGKTNTTWGHERRTGSKKKRNCKYHTK